MTSDLPLSNNIHIHCPNIQSFKVAAWLLPSEENIHILLSFMEYLCTNNYSKGSISNYMAAISTFYIIYTLDTYCFKDERILLFLRSLEITAPLTSRIRTTVDIKLLTSIITLYDLEAPTVFKPLYLTFFASFLRLCNLLLHTVKTFNFTRQLARGDLIIAKDWALLIIKWSETIQNRRDNVTLPLPYLVTLPLPCFAPVQLSIK